MWDIRTICYHQFSASTHLSTSRGTDYKLISWGCTLTPSSDCTTGTLSCPHPCLRTTRCRRQTAYIYVLFILSFEYLIVVLVDCFLIELDIHNVVAIDERNGFIYYFTDIIRRATFTGENITDILDLGPGMVCNMIFLLVLDQYCQLF